MDGVLRNYSLINERCNQKFTHSSHRLTQGDKSMTLQEQVKQAKAKIQTLNREIRVAKKEKGKLTRLEKQISKLNGNLVQLTGEEIPITVSV